MIDKMLGRSTILVGLLLVSGWIYNAVVFGGLGWWTPTFFCAAGGIVSGAVLTVVWGFWYAEAASRIKEGKKRDQGRHAIALSIALLAILCTAGLVTIGVWASHLAQTYTDKDSVWYACSAAFWFLVCAMIPGVGGPILWALFDCGNLKDNG